MKVLLVKLSSMGDIIHTLPAITDAVNVLPNIKFTWLIDENFQEIAHWHPAVEKIIPIALRNRSANKIFMSIKQLRKNSFDVIIDAQGLLKSAVLARLARSTVYAGYDKFSSRESIASIFYNNKYKVDQQLHAIDRTRQLFSRALGYPLTNSKISYGVDWSQLIEKSSITQPYLVFLHGTTWESKHWPEEYWLKLAVLASKYGFKVHVTWSTVEQKLRAQRLAALADNVVLLDHLSINQAAKVLYNATGVVAVDTGFAHLSAALGTPTIGMYGATNINKCGTVGAMSLNLSSKFSCAPCGNRVCSYIGERTYNPPCFTEISPQVVWDNLYKLLKIS